MNKFMKTEIKHTPTPWHVAELGFEYPVIKGSDDVCIVKTDCSISSKNWVEDYGQSKANAALIVKSVNEYAALCDLANAIPSLIRAFRFAEGRDISEKAIKSAEIALANLESIRNQK